MFYPLRFKPLFMERVWGGRSLEALYGKPLPAGVPIGESWEVTDRPEAVSEVAEGPLVGQTLRDLMERDRGGFLGEVSHPSPRFPLLIKILDAQQKLSLQVHPPAALAGELGGEPKTEMWYAAHTTPDAAFYAGLKRGVSRAHFEECLRKGTVADCFHRIPVGIGDALFLPSGRVHALGAGNVIFEVQQNSNTTYRVYDWDRVGLDGKPRDLHLEQSLASIDFADFEPRLIETSWHATDQGEARELVSHALFQVHHERWQPAATEEIQRQRRIQILAVLRGELQVFHQDRTYAYRPGDFAVLPASLQEVVLLTDATTELLRIRPS